MTNHEHRWVIITALVCSTIAAIWGDSNRTVAAPLPVRKPVRDLGRFSTYRAGIAAYNDSHDIGPPKVSR